MPATKAQLIARLHECVLTKQDQGIVEACQEYLAAGFDVNEAVTDGLLAAMGKASQLYDARAYSVADVLLCSDALYAGLAILKPYLPQATQSHVAKKVVIGVVEGDPHDVGKNLVKVMLETAGFEVYDLGRDVPLDAFVDKVQEVDADIVAMTTLMTTTMEGMGRVVQKLKDAGLRDKVKVMVGGGPVSKRFAEEIGADGYSSGASEAVEVAKRLLDQQ